MADVWFTEAAVDDLRRIGPEAVPRVLRKILLLEQNPEAGPTLGGNLTGFRKLVVGRNTWRVVYRVVDAGAAVEICEVWAVGARRESEVYEEAAARVREATAIRPELAGLADVVQRLGKLSGGIEPDRTPPAEPVPDWLADRLVYTVGLRREQVAALDLEKAVDIWTDHVSRPS